MPFKVDKKKSEFDVYEIGDEIIVQGKLVLTKKGEEGPRIREIEVDGIIIPVIMVTGYDPGALASEMSEQTGTAVAYYPEPDGVMAAVYQNGEMTKKQKIRDSIEDVLKRAAALGQNVYECWSTNASGAPQTLLGYVVVTPPNSLSEGLLEIV